MKKAPLRQPQAGHAEPCIPYRRFRHGAGAASFHGAGHIVRLPLGGVPFPRLPQRPYHERTVLRCHGIGFANFSGAAVYRFLHRRCKERLHKGVSPPNHRIAVYRGQGRGLRCFRRAGAGDIHSLRLCRAAVPAHGGLPQAWGKCAELLWQSNGNCAHVLRLGGILVAYRADLRRPHEQQVYGICKEGKE